VRLPLRDQIKILVLKGVDYGYDPLVSEIFAQQTIGWRAMHSQGRGLFSVFLTNLPDIDSRSVREERWCATR
jgi:hypothetical protein